MPEPAPIHRSSVRDPSSSGSVSDLDDSAFLGLSGPIQDLLCAAAAYARAGIDVRDHGGLPLTLTVAPACVGCRQRTPLIHLRCKSEVRTSLKGAAPHLCPHRQGLTVTAGGRLVVIAPASTAASFGRLISRLLAMANELTGPDRNQAGFGASDPDEAGTLTVTVRSLIAAIEAKDPYTRGHSVRVHLMSRALGASVGIDREKARDLYWASLLHDIGKIGVPDRILKKPGKLTEEESRVMREHPVRGDLMLSPLAWLARARKGIRHHHERVDGLGYPDGLRGDDIPLIARIIAVADTFDAVTSSRSYRRERGVKVALEELRDARGTQLDPALVTSFDLHFDRILDALATAPVPLEGLVLDREMIPEAA